MSRQKNENIVKPTDSRNDKIDKQTKKMTSSADIKNQFLYDAGLCGSFIVILIIIFISSLILKRKTINTNKLIIK